MLAIFLLLTEVQEGAVEGSFAGGFGSDGFWGTESRNPAYRYRTRKRLFARKEPVNAR